MKQRVSICLKCEHLQYFSSEENIGIECGFVACFEVVGHPPLMNPLHIGLVKVIEEDDWDIHVAKSDDENTLAEIRKINPERVQWNNKFKTPPNCPWQLEHTLLEQK